MTMLLLISLATAVLSFGACALTLYAARELRLGADESDGRQKIHDHWVPRLGGVPIAVASFVGVMAWAWYTHPTFTLLATSLIVCSLPIFTAGLLEDLTRRVSPALRLWVAFVSAALAFWLLEARMLRVDIPALDLLLNAYTVFSLLVTLVAVGGVAHATNIIDGCNGLAGGVCVIALCAIAAIAAQAGDPFVGASALILAAATMGFLFWNFPNGRIFLGDAGAYMLGCLMAILSLMLVVRNPEVSPWSLLLVLIYPVWETLFSMFRRGRHQLSSISQPDALHLHQLIMRRMVRRYGVRPSGSAKVWRNARTSPYLWLLAGLSAIPAVVFWDSTLMALLFCAMFMVTYGLSYRAVVTFRVPRVLVQAPREIESLREAP